MKKRSAIEAIVLVFIGALLVGIAVGVYFVTAGVSARSQPSSLETFASRTVRGAAVRAHAGGVRNPVALTDAVVKEGMEHFADHCAVCHGNDGSGETEMG